MKKALCLLATIAIAAIVAAPSAQAADGKELFLAQKCNMCHSVPTAGIQRTAKAAAGPDLVNLKSDEASLTKWLRKESEKNGKKHAKAFVGSPADLKTLVAWLQAQKK